HLPRSRHALSWMSLASDLTMILVWLGDLSALPPASRTRLSFTERRMASGELPVQIAPDVQSPPPATAATGPDRPELTMALPQTGIFALGTLAHAYLEFDLNPDAEPSAMVATAAGLGEPRTTLGGVNLVTGMRPELWAAVA